MDAFIGARVRINNRARCAHRKFGVVVNTIQFNKALVQLDGDPEGAHTPYDFSDLEAVFDQFDRVMAFGAHLQPVGKGQVIRYIPKDEPAWAGWFEVQLDKDPVGSTSNYPYNNLRFIEACPHEEDFRVGDHVEILPTDSCYAGKRGVVRGFSGDQVEVDFGNEKSTFAYVKDLKKINDAKSVMDILKMLASGFTSKKTAGEVLGIPEKTLDEIQKGMGIPTKYLFPEGMVKNREEELMRPLPSDTIFRVKTKNDPPAIAKAKALLKERELAAGYGMADISEYYKQKIAAGLGVPPEVLGKPGESKTTVSATIVLASGREVRMPDPNPEKWELFETRTLGPASRVRARRGAPHTDEDSYLIVAHCAQEGKAEEKPAVAHKEGRCWLKDMTRIVNMTEKPDHFTTKYAYATELRFYKERIIDAEFDSDLPYPTLRAYLW